MAELIRALRRVVSRTRSSAVSVDADAMAEKKIRKIATSKKQLKDKVKELEELLSEAHRQWDLKSKECEQERNAHSITQAKNDKMKKTLRLKKESLKVWMAELEEKHQKALETIAQLESEKSSLTSQVDRLQDTMQGMGRLQAETHRECDELMDDCKQEREARSSLQAENDKLKEVLMQKEESLKDSLAEETEKHQKTVETIAQLESEKSSLTSQVEGLQETMQAMRNQLSETHRECDELINDCKREREARSSLQAENDKLKEMLMQKEEILKVWMAKAEDKHENTVKTIAQLECEKTSLTSQVERLQETVQAMRNQLSETHSILKAENDKMQETLWLKEELLKDSLAEAEDKHQKTVETIAQLESEKSSLTSQVERLQETVQTMGSLLSETHKESDELAHDCKREREARSILQVENDEIKETLMQTEESLKVSLAEIQAKHQKTVETIAQLESEKSSLTSQVKRLRETVQAMGNQLSETHSECDELIDTCKQEKEARSSLQAKNDKLKAILMQKEESLKVNRSESKGYQSVPKGPTPACSRLRQPSQASHKPQPPHSKR